MLPQPINGTEAYLKAVHDRLGEILDRLPSAAPPKEPADGVVELREPAAPAPAPQDAEPEPEPVAATSGQDSAPKPARTPRKRSAPTKKEP